jgi:myo-inositol-1(or 4)-monophosphatase
MFDAIPSHLAKSLAAAVETVTAEVRPKLIETAITGRPAETPNHRHEDNFLSEYDLWMHGRYRQFLAESVGSFIYASEEADPEVVGDDEDPDLCILVDPLDTSELAVRALNGYTHVLAYSRRSRRPIAAVVGDIYHHIRFYIGAQDDNGRDHAIAVTADGEVCNLKPATLTSLPGALVTNYSMKPAERFAALASQNTLLDALNRPDADGRHRGRIGVDFGSVGLCHVAAGFTDAMVEFAKGFAIWDLLPGHYILCAAGGCVLDLNGTPISIDCGFESIQAISTAMNKRQKFVAAGRPELANAIVHELTI